MDTRLPVGCLILHGFTSHLECVSPVAERMQRRGIPYRMPVLRGHGATPEALLGVTWRDWYADAEAGLADLLRETQSAVVVGLSMGALAALQLGMEHPQEVNGVVAAAPALLWADPLGFLAPVLAKVIKFWPVDVSKAFADPELAKKSQNYRRAPTGAGASWLEWGKIIRRRLGEFNRPILILHPRHDRVAAPQGAQIIYDNIASAQKRLVWLEKSGHEVFQDVERDLVGDLVEAFVVERRNIAQG